MKMCAMLYVRWAEHTVWNVYVVKCWTGVDRSEKCVPNDVPLCWADVFGVKNYISILFYPVWRSLLQHSFF